MHASSRWGSTDSIVDAPGALEITRSDGADEAGIARYFRASINCNSRELLVDDGPEELPIDIAARRQN